jgi:hypothetical protein
LTQITVAKLRISKYLVIALSYLLFNINGNPWESSIVECNSLFFYQCTGVTFSHVVLFMVGVQGYSNRIPTVFVAVT